jgi:hypothetical protein
MLASVSRAPLSLNALCSVTSHARPHAVIVLSLKVAVSLFPPSLLSGSASSAVHACLLACEDATGALPTLPPPNTSWRLTGRRVAVSSSACGLLVRGLARRLFSASPTRMSRLVACLLCFAPTHHSGRSVVLSAPMLWLSVWDRHRPPRLPLLCRRCTVRCQCLSGSRPCGRHSAVCVLATEPPPDEPRRHPPLLTTAMVLAAAG